ncbi:DUF4184 family protein [Longimicrobium sp.]|uniref:DUF4184 family protein n=1 Tax=Longimicrobium sp. TaxID=2029185 RepID=UPI002E32DA0A|nr:DUF4184 family protein [Longimicrobium sp.]HEX6038810.1 DUF4184 family protein [Longimicrobium sp.]
MHIASAGAFAIRLPSIRCPMPFTIAHAAAALPVRRAWRALPLDALVLGAMSPDFEYVLRLAVQGRYWHTPSGLLLASVPATLIAVRLWRALVRPALVPLLPAGMRPITRPSSSASAVLLAAAAALAGAITHVLWDGFTHRTGWAVMRMPALLEPASPLGLSVPWYNVLQHASTLLGGTVLLIAFGGWMRRHPPEARRFAPGQGRALVRAAAIIIGAAVLASLVNGARALGSGPEWVLGYAAVGGMAGLALAATAYALLSRIRP